LAYAQRYGWRKGKLDHLHHSLTIKTELFPRFKQNWLLARLRIVVLCCHSVSRLFNSRSAIAHMLNGLKALPMVITVHSIDVGKEMDFLKSATLILPGL
jgi:hypothetical protein